MMFQCDHLDQMSFFNAEYSSTLNSEDVFDPELPLLKMKAKGGTMALWRKHLDQFVTPLPSTSSSFLPILFSPPGYKPTVHITIYLPTAGQDDNFVDEIVKLNIYMAELNEKYPDAAVFVRGDANVNKKDKKRFQIFKTFCEDWSLSILDIKHTTYHHFIGHGLSDSQLDVLLHPHDQPESLLQIYCRLDSCLITSHHDALRSSFILARGDPASSAPDLPLAPEIKNSRVKILWNEEGILQYQKCVSTNLSKLRSSWLDPSSEVSFSVLLQSTNSFLDMCARETNGFISLGVTPTEKSTKIPKYLRKSEKMLLKSYRMMKAKTSPDTITAHAQQKRHHRQLLRYHEIQRGYSRDRVLDKLCSSSPSQAYKSIKSVRSSKVKKISKLHVGNRIFTGNKVPDGMYESIRCLKTEQDSENISNEHPDFSKEYLFILEICRAGKAIPPISKHDSDKILNSIRKNVNDFYSITALHYTNAGFAGYEHFNLILNAIISNINLAGLSELNTIYACVLYKGHAKDRTSERSYRTLSTCPLLAKGLDIYVRSLSVKDWNRQQAPTQYQGQGMSHELAALLLTETVQHSLNVSKLPVFAIFLDAKSAFDRVKKDILIRNLFTAGTSGHALLYLDKRLSNRQTFCDFDRRLMGPIKDTRGLEQGAVSSSDEYKLYNNEQASSSQQSKLGVPLRDTVISCISLADDASLLSNNIHDLKNLLYLTTLYCQKYKVDLVPDKTKLVVFCRNEEDFLVRYSKLISSISLNGDPIPFSQQAEHLGIIRSCNGNLPNLVERFSAHKRKLFSVLPAGLALHHNANPAACLRVEQIYALPVLLSGLSALVLSSSEVDLLTAHYKKILSRLMKLHDRSSDSAVYFLAGSLPARALLHLRQLSLFSMICLLDKNILKTIAVNILVEAKSSARSWFQQIRDICVMYGLPHPLSLLRSPLTKAKFGNLCKQKVYEYWHLKLSQQANLPSLQYLHPSHLSLQCPHPIWTSLDGNPYQAKAARIQAVFLSGKYRTEKLCRFWSRNKEGICLLQPCKGLKISEDIEHVLLHCSALSDVRRRLVNFTTTYTSDKPVLRTIVDSYLYAPSTSLRMQFILDCSVLPLVIAEVQAQGKIIHQHLFRITRTWCRSLHVSRLKQLGRYLGC